MPSCCCSRLVLSNDAEGKRGMGVMMACVFSICACAPEMLLLVHLGTCAPCLLHTMVRVPTVVEPASRASLLHLSPRLPRPPVLSHSRGGLAGWPQHGPH